MEGSTQPVDTPPGGSDVPNSTTGGMGQEVVNSESGGRGTLGLTAAKGYGTGRDTLDPMAAKVNHAERHRNDLLTRVHYAERGSPDLLAARAHYAERDSQDLTGERTHLVRSANSIREGGIEFETNCSH